MRYRILHDMIGPRLHWASDDDENPTQVGPWGKGEEVEGDLLGGPEQVKRLLELGAIEVAPVYPSGHAPAVPEAEKPLAPPAPQLPNPAARRRAGSPKGE